MSQVTDPNSGNLASIYVGDLKPEVSEQNLWNLFSAYGHVVSVRICRDAQTQTSLRYAYVNYRSSADAEKAIKLANFLLIDGRPCRVMWSMRDSNKRKLGIGNLFVKNIHPDVDSKSLYDAFSHFGSILSCKVACDDYGVSKGYGFVQFHFEKDAEHARKKSDGTAFRNKRLVVTNFLPKSRRPNAKTIDPNEYTNIFVKNFGTELNDAALKELFSKFGEFTSCVVSLDAAGKSLGYGFVNMASPDAAKKAVEEMNDYELPNKNKLFVCRAQKKLEREAFLRHQHEQRKREFYKQYQDRNVYVKNFDESVTDEKLKEMFSSYGKISSVQVMKDEHGKSKGFGFVCFSTAEEAKNAIAGMHAKVLDSKPLFVCLAQSKEERKKIIEQRAYSSSFRPPTFPHGQVQFMYPPPGPPVQYATNQFPRYPPGPTARAPQRPMQQIQPGTMPPPQNYNQQSGQRSNQNYAQGHQYHGQNNYRGRGASRYQQQQQQHPQISAYTPRPNMPSHVGVGVNNIVSEGGRSKRDDQRAPQQKHSTDPHTLFKDKVYRACQALFREKNYPMDQVGAVSGVVIDYYTNSSAVNVEDAEITQTILSAYSEWTKNQSNNDGMQF